MKNFENPSSTEEDKGNGAINEQIKEILSPIKEVEDKRKKESKETLENSENEYSQAKKIAEDIVLELNNIGDIPGQLKINISHKRNMAERYHMAQTPTETNKEDINITLDFINTSPHCMPSMTYTIDKNDNVQSVVSQIKLGILEQVKRISDSYKRSHKE